MADQAASAISVAAPTPPRKRKRAANPTTGLQEPKPKPIECPVCLTPRIPRLIHTLSNCNCTYCTYCIREVFTAALQREDGVSNYPAMCCGRVVDYDLFEPHLTPQLRKVYKSRIEEEESLRDDRVYCGNQKCKLYILKANIKDGFGSCGKCKMKTCIKPECNKPMADHLGIYTICPDDLETEALKELAKEKGWKRCPRCYALTERTKGCNDIRCICHTEWCYTCGKAVKGTKNPCQCHPPPAPRLTPRVAEDNIQVERDVIIVQDDVDMVDVKPSIEDIEGRPQRNYNRNEDSIAELTSHVSMSRRSSPRLELDVVAELDNLAAPISRGGADMTPRTADQDGVVLSEATSSLYPDSGTSVEEESLEDMLQAFNNYQAAPVMEDITLDKSITPHLEQFRDSIAQTHHDSHGNTISDTFPTPVPASTADTTDLNDIAESIRTILPESSEEHYTEILNTSKESTISARNAASSTELTKLTKPNAEINTDSLPNMSRSSPNLEKNFTCSEGSSSQLVQTQETTPPDNGAECLLNSIGEYLGVHGEEIKVERSRNE